MNKWKLFLVSTAIAVGIGGAFASNYKTCDLCVYYDQYKLEGGTYVWAGTYGQDYICLSGGGVCTFYRPSISSPYIPCRTGVYFEIPQNNKKK
jgi:hypothetical protein